MTDVNLWALTRHAFVAAVSAHGNVAQLADATISEHLTRPRVVDS